MKSKRGSSLVLVIILSAVILLYYTTSWQSTSLMVDVFYKRYEYEKKFRLTEALYKYGLSFVINNFDILEKQKEQNINSINIYAGPWPFNSQSHAGIFHLGFMNYNKVNLEADLIDKSKNIFKIRAILEIEEIENKQVNKKFKKFSILSWQVN